MKIKKEKREKKETSIRKEKAFTLVEVVVALFVFSVLMVSISQVYMQFVEVQRKSASMQRRVENLQLASNLVSKTARSSSIVSPIAPASGTISSLGQLRLFDYSRTVGNCLVYRINNGALEVASSIGQTANETECNSVTFPSGSTTAFIPITDGAYNVFGSFYYRIPVAGSSVGFLAVSLWACDEVVACAASDSSAMKVQSSVSMRP